MTDTTPTTVPPEGHLVLELPGGLAPSAVVQVALVVALPDGRLAGVMGEMEGLAPLPRRAVADVLDGLADGLYAQAAELDGGLAQ